MKILENYLSNVQRLIVFTIMLLIASSVFGGPLGLIVRGERHVLLLLLVLLSFYKIWSSKKEKIWTNKQFACMVAAPVLFLLINLLWIWPFGGETREQFQYGLLDAQSLILLPVTALVFLAINSSKYSINRLGRLSIVMCFILAVGQIFIWVLLRFNDISHDVIYDFVNIYFGTKDSVAILKQPSNQGFYYRVVWISSYWLLFAVFISPLVIRCKVKLIVLQAIFGVAIIASYTRGIWLGLFIGIGIFTLLINVILHSKYATGTHQKIRSKWYASLLGLILSFFLVFALDSAQGVSGLMVSRLYVKSGSYTEEKYVIRDESAIERQAQAIKLLDMWKNRPILGHGYGAYMKDHFTHEDRPFLYEMLPFALLMKLGILGFGIYLSFFCYILFRLLRLAFRAAQGVAIFSGLVAYLIQVHTNPVFFSFTGMLIFSIFIFIWLSLENHKNGVNVNEN